MNTTKPLAQRITRGSTKLDANYVLWEEVGGVIAEIDGDSLSEKKANAELILETFQVTHETGKTPAELVQLLRDVVEAYKGTDLLGFRTIINRIENIL